MYKRQIQYFVVHLQFTLVVIFTLATAAALKTGTPNETEVVPTPNHGKAF